MPPAVDAAGGSSPVGSNNNMSNTNNNTKPKARLIISKLRMENFKSYGGVQEIGPFHKSFTAIIGPNGSGKSNVIDAMLFVFGRRANQIRLKKLSELIHNSYDAGDINHCSVEVHFCYILDDQNDKDAYSVVDGTQFFIKRVVTRNNQSQYFINNEPSTVNQVVEKLKNECQIDLDHNRFLILQGEVEQIATMKPKSPPGSSETGLLEYLEDIIGTSSFKPELEKQQNITEDLTQIRQSKLLEQDSLKTKLVLSKGSVDQKVQYTEGSFQHSNSVFLEYYVKFHFFALRYRVAAKKAIEYAHRGSEIILKLKRLSKLKNQAESKYKKDHAQLANYQNQIEDLLAQFNVFQENHNKWTQQSDSIQKNQIDKLMQKKENEMNTILQQRRAKEEQEKRLPLVIAEMEKKKEEVIETQTQLDEKIETVSKLTEPYKLKLQEIAKENEPLQRKLDDAKQHEQRLIGEYKILQQKLSHGNQNQRDLEHDIQRSKDAVAALTSELTDAQARNEELRQQRSESQIEVRTIVTKVNEQSAKYSQFMNMANELRGKMAELQNNNNMDDDFATTSSSTTQSGQSSINYSKMQPHHRLLENKYLQQGSSFKDVYGRIADICWVDPQYEIAMANACGDSQNIVVLNANLASIAIQFLRSNNYGRASFLPLDSVVVQHAKRKFEAEAARPPPAPEGSQRLFDLVHFPTDLPDHLLTMFKVVLHKSVGETYVCPDVNTASRIAYADRSRPKRTVALTGELMQPSGVMSGGRVKRNVFATSLQDCTERMAPAVFTKTSHATQLKARKKAEDDNKNDEKRRIEAEKIQIEMNKIMNDASEAQRQGDQFARIKSEALNKLSDLGAQFSKNENEIAQLKLQLGNEQETLRTHEETQKHSQNVTQRRALEANQLKDKEAELTAAREVTTALREEQSGSEAQKADLLQKIVKSGGGEVAAIRKRLVATTDDIDRLETDQREITRNLAKADDRTAQRQATVDQLDLDMAKFQKQIEELDVKINKTLDDAQAVVEKKAAVEQLHRQLHEKLANGQDLSIEFARMINEYEPHQLEAEAKTDSANDRLRKCFSEMESSRKGMRQGIRGALQDFQELIQAEAPPDPFAVAQLVHKYRKAGFINRFLTQQEVEKKRLEQEELEQNGGTARRGRKAAAVVVQMDNSDSDDEEENAEELKLRLEQQEWTALAEVEFARLYPAPVQNDVFSQQYEEAVKRSTDDIRGRLPWFAPKWEQIPAVQWGEQHYQVPEMCIDPATTELPERLPWFQLTVTYKNKKEHEQEQSAKNRMGDSADNNSKLERNKGENKGENDDENVDNIKSGRRNPKMEVKSEEEQKRGGNRRGGNKRANNNNDGDDSDDDDEAHPSIDFDDPHLSAAQRAELILADDSNDPDAQIAIIEDNLSSIMEFTQLGDEDPRNALRRLENESRQLEERVTAIGSVESHAVDEYHKRQLEAAALAQYLDILSKERDAEKLKYEILKKERTRIFMKGLHEISAQLKTLYRLLTMGGDAELELSDQNDPFMDGITFSVRPPKKSWKQIQNLSGGEKTLSSLSLVFALHYFKPTPLYVMDEIDAALDYRNVSIVANYIQQRTNNNAQFIIISLRNNMFELSNRLVGIYKTNDRTKSITIDPREYIKNQLMQRQHQQQLKFQQQQQQQQLQQHYHQDQDDGQMDNQA